MRTVCLYIIVITFTVLLSFLGKNYKVNLSDLKVCSPLNNSKNAFGEESRSKSSNNSFFLPFLLAMLPTIVVFSLRYGIGEDYFAYEDMYFRLHQASVKTYFQYHMTGVGDYYVEPFYFLLNKISPNYHFLQFIIIFMIAANIAATENEFPEFRGFIVYVFLCCNFVYSMNATRYVLGLSFIVLAIAHLLKSRYLKFFFYVGIAALFHKTLVVALLFYFIRGKKDPIANRIMNKVIIGVAAGSAVLIPIVMRVASKVSFFSRYFSTGIYAASDSMEMSLIWTMHILPVAITLIFVPKKHFEGDVLFTTIYRIFILEIPFRFMAFYNVWYGRLARIPQIIEVFMIPYILSLQNNKSNKKLLIIYYLLWYLFYFVYYYITNGAAEYQWILGR